VRPIVLVSALLILASVTYASSPAPLGKLLSRQYTAMKASDPIVVLVYFKDKGARHTSSFNDASRLLSPASIERRLRFRSPDRVIDESDYPLNSSYVESVSRMVMNVRHELKWFNAVSVTATKEEIESIRQLPFVSQVEMVGRWKKKQDEIAQPLGKEPTPPAQPLGTTSLNYGTSFNQVNTIHVPPVHDLGIFGQGVVICLMDNGFRNPLHQAFDSMVIIATHDFVDHKTSVIPNDPDATFGSHGIWTLSTIGGNFPGQLIGPAFKAHFLLTRTENDSSETPIEEDNWVAALQWADSIGVDVTSTSLGYLGFDAPYTSLTAADMNGHTAIISQAAAHGAALGIVVVNAAGNNGGGDGIHNTLNAPADADSIITAGAIDATGTRAVFSSVGPTTDIPARIKPDVMAMGVSTKAASSTDTVGYVSVSGTSFACPLSAGVAALIRSANPSLTPLQVRDAMRNTANNAATPNNLYGWGILNADSALKYFGVTSLGLGSISGTAFNDLNGNGVKDTGEGGVAGVRIVLSGVVAESTVTDGSGNFTFGGLAIDTYYSLHQQSPAGWTALGGPTRLLLLQPTDTTNVNFGDFQNATVSGNVYSDVNKNGIYDGGDTALAQWSVSISGPVTQSVLSNSGGAYSFSNLPPGIYTIAESTHFDWLQSYPPQNGVYSVTTRSGLDTTELNFLNYFDTVYNYPVAAGWNLLSLPQNPANHAKGAIYPSAISKAFIYNHAYAPVDTLQVGAGYWLKFTNAQNIFIFGTAITTDTISVAAGWNMIGALSKPIAASSIQQNPTGNLSSNYFGYNGSYTIADTLLPHRGYWIKAKNDGQLYLNSTSIAPATSTSPTASKSPENIVTFTDAAKHHQSLFFTNDESQNGKSSQYELPPLPPDGGFDVRFANGCLAAAAPGDMQILVTSANYPVTVTWTAAGRASASLNIDGNEIQMAGKGELVLHQPPSDLRLRAPGAIGKTIPTAFALEQNYPNPFNPSTEFRYDLTKDGTVSLKIYNVLGEEIAQVVNGLQPSGSHTARWNAGGQPSGLYLARIIMSDRSGKLLYSATQKVMLLK